MMVSELLFEIGTEEIPSGYLARGLADLKNLSGVDCIHLLQKMVSLIHVVRLQIFRQASEKQMLL